jgi:hypothetical protein
MGVEYDVQRVKTKIGDVIKPNNMGAWLRNPLIFPGTHIGQFS